MSKVYQWILDLNLSLVAYFVLPIENKNKSYVSCEAAQKLLPSPRLEFPHRDSPEKANTAIASSISRGDRCLSVLLQLTDVVVIELVGSLVPD